MADADHLRSLTESNNQLRTALIYVGKELAGAKADGEALYHALEYVLTHSGSSGGREAGEGLVFGTNRATAIEMATTIFDTATLGAVLHSCSTRIERSAAKSQFDVARQKRRLEAESLESLEDKLRTNSPA